LVGLIDLAKTSTPSVDFDLLRKTAPGYLRLSVPHIFNFVVTYCTFAMAHLTAAAVTITCSDQPLDLSFHPSKATLVAAALVDGTVELHDFALASANARTSESAAAASELSDDDDDDEDDTIVSSTAVHTQLIANKDNGGGAAASAKQASCRAVRFSSDGTSLWTGGSAGDVVCLDAATVSTFAMGNSKGKSSIRYTIPEAAHLKSPIQVLYELPEKNLLVTGDEAGGVRLWDPRMLDASGSSSSNKQQRQCPMGCVASWKEHEDYVSALQHDSAADGHTLLATSADGTLSVYDLRMAAAAARQPQSNQNVPGVVRRSDPQEDELLSLCILKHGRKVVCGTAEGVLAVFSFGVWGDVSDRFPGHPASIDAVLKVDEDTVLTGSSDGLIRVVSIHPDKFIGVLGDNHEGFPIEKLQFTANRSYVGSVTHDNYIRLWDARVLQDDHDNDDDDDDAMDHVKMAPAPPPIVAASAKTTDSDEEWEDMDEEMMEEDKDSDDSGDDEDSGDEDQGKDKKTSKNDKRAGRLKSDNDRFFDDL
jgi:WD repeat-containing protein 55